MSFNGIRLLPDYGCKIEIDVVQLLKENEIEALKDKCVDLMLENADYVWDEIARETAKKRANTRKLRTGFND